MFVLALLASLGFAAEQRVESKDELTMRLLGVRPSAAAVVDGASAGPETLEDSLKSVPKDIGSLPTLAVAATQPAVPTLKALSAERASKSEPVAVLKATKLPSLPTVSPSNIELNELLRNQEAQRLLSDSVPALGHELNDLVEEATESEQEGGLPSVPWWLPASLLGAAGLFLFTRREGGLRQLGLGNTATPMRVLSRTALGQNTGLALVELDDGAGATRRVLVGFGGGSPNLVTELGTQVASAPVLAEPKPAPVLFTPAPAPRIPSVEDFGFQTAPTLPDLSMAHRPIELPPEPVMTTAVEPRSSTRRSVLNSKTRTLRPPGKQQEFSEILRDEFETPIPRRSADAALALVEEVLSERDPDENPEPPLRTARPWAGSRFQGTA